MKKLFRKKEKGDIAIIAMFASILFVLMLAIVVDFGLVYYQSAKLQNAVDATTVAVAHDLMSDDNAVQNTAEKYMRENGIDLTKYGTGVTTSTDLKTVITYGDDKAKVTIDKKGLLTEETQQEDEDKYITSGYLKLTVYIRSNGLLSGLSGIKNLRLEKSGYAQCAMKYTDMPEALKYTIFGNSSVTTNDYRNMTVQLNGRTAGNGAQIATNIFQYFVNKVNETLIQPLIGILGGNPNYNKLLNVSTSHIITNGDVHSNSDISIGVNTLQASRSKDLDYDGKSDECTCQSKCSSSAINELCDVCQANYKNCEGDTQSHEDYNQVTYTAVNTIDFSHGKIIDSMPAGSFSAGLIDGGNGGFANTYFQNYQYIEQTQVALNIIDTMDFSTIHSQYDLESQYTAKAEYYLENNISLIDSQKSAVLEQKNNLQYISYCKYSLKNQKSIVYNTNNNLSNSVMQGIQGGTTVSTMLQHVVENGTDVPADDFSKSRYDKVTKDSFTVNFTKTDGSSSCELIIPDVEVTNRDVSGMTTKSLMNDTADSGYRFALAKTFQQFSEYIDAPNMKPYFIRTINRSVKNATTTKSSADSSSNDKEDSVSVKDAVKKSGDELTDLINSKDSLATVRNLNPTEPGNATSKTGADLDSTYSSEYDNQYSQEGSLTNLLTSPFFKRKVTTKTNGDLKNPSNYDVKYYDTDSEEHKTFKGENLYKTDEDGNSVLKNGTDFVKEQQADSIKNKYGTNAVSEFKKKNINGKVKYASAAVNEALEQYKEYGKETVGTKKKEFINSKSYTAYSDENTRSAFPNEDKFLRENIGVPFKTLKEKLEQDKNDFTGIDNSIQVEEPTVPKAEIPSITVSGSTYKTVNDTPYVIQGSGTGEAEYTSAPVQLSKAEYTYTKYGNESALVGETSNGTKVYANIAYYNALAYPNEESYEQVIIKDSSNKGTFNITSNKGSFIFGYYILTFSPSKNRLDSSLNRAGLDSEESTNFCIFVKDENALNSAIPGYRRLYSTDELKAGDKYIIAHPGSYSNLSQGQTSASTDWYVLFPSLPEAGSLNSHTGKIVYGSMEDTNIRIKSSGTVYCHTGRKSNSRYDTSDTSAPVFNIVNDCENSNFSIGYLNFDVSSLLGKGLTVDSAEFSMLVKGNKGSDCQGITVWYAKNNASVRDLSGASDWKDKDLFAVSSGKHLDKAKDKFSLQYIANYDKDVLTENYQMTFDLANAINYAIKNNNGTVTVMLLQSQPGGKNGEGRHDSSATNSWTDTYISFRSRAQVNAKLVANNPYNTSAAPVSADKIIADYIPKFSWNYHPSTNVDDNFAWSNFNGEFVHLSGNGGWYRAKPDKLPLYSEIYDTGWGLTVFPGVQNKDNLRFRQYIWNNDKGAQFAQGTVTAIEGKEVRDGGSQRKDVKTPVAYFAFQQTFFNHNSLGSSAEGGPADDADHSPANVIVNGNAWTTSFVSDVPDSHGNMVINGDLYMQSYSSSGAFDVLPDNNVNIIVNGTIYCKDGLSVNVPKNVTLFAQSIEGGVINNSGTIILNSYSSTNNTITNNSTGKIYVYGNLYTQYVVNNGIIEVVGNVDVPGNISSGASSTLSAASIKTGDFYQNGLTYVHNGNVEVANTLNVQGNLYVKQGSIKSGKNSNVYSGGKVYASGDFICNETLTLEGCTVTIRGNIKNHKIVGTQVSLKAANVVSEIIEISSTSKIYIDESIDTRRIYNKGILYIQPATDKTVTVKSVYNAKGAELTVNGSLNVVDKVDDGGYVQASIINLGGLYVGGGISSAYRIYNDGGEMYVKGDVGVYNTDDSLDDSDVFVMSGENAQAYIGGVLRSDHNGRSIKVGGTGVRSTLSIFGSGSDSCFGKVDDETCIENLTLENESANVYLGAGKYDDNYSSDSYKGRKVSISGNFKNNGRCYVYGSLEVEGSSTELGGTAVNVTAPGTYVADNFEFDGDVVLSGTHTFVTYEDAECGSVTVNDSAKIYGLNKLEFDSDIVTITSTGIVYCGAETNSDSFSTILNLVGADDGTFSGKLFYPGNNKTSSSVQSIMLATPDRFTHGEFRTDGSVTMRNSIDMFDNSYFYVGEATYFDNNLIVNNLGELYLMGSVISANGTNEFVFTTGSTNYIGPINDTSLGRLIQNKSFTVGGNNYIANSIEANKNNNAPDKTNMTGARWTSVAVLDGETHISGDLTVVNKSRGVLVNSDATLACNNLITYSTIYNDGNLIMQGNLTYPEISGEFSDCVTKSGVNFGTGSTIWNKEHGTIFVGGNGNTTVGGRIENYGKFYHNGSANVYGWREDYSSWTLSDKYVIGVVNGMNSVMHFSGTLTTDNSVYNMDNATFSCDRLDTKRGLYNVSGNFVVLSELVVSHSSGIPTMRDNDGCCIRNGKEGNAGAVNAMMFIGGNNELVFDGGIANNGKFYMESSKVSFNEHSTKDTMYFRVVGENRDQTFYSRSNGDNNVASKWDHAPRFSIETGDRSFTHFAGDVSCEAGVITGANSVFSVEKDLLYGMAILNGGTMYIKGKVDYSSNHYKENNIEVFYSGDQKKGTYSIINGYRNVGYGGNGAQSSDQNINAYFYCGGSLTTGSTSANDGGTIQNWGSMYVNGDMNIYGSQGYTINMVGFSGQLGSKTFIAGRLCSSDGIVTMNDTMLVIDGDYTATRCCKFGTTETAQGNDDLNLMSYTYIGGNCLTSTRGQNGNGNIGIYGCTWNYTEFHSNANVYIGGEFFSNSIVTPGVNAVIAVDGKDSVPKTEFQRGFLENIKKKIKDLILESQNIDTSKFKFSITGSTNAGQNFSFEANDSNSFMYTLVVRGSVYVEEPFRFRDMSKAFIYGDFINTTSNTSRNVEIGKSIGSADNTWAKETAFKTGNDYNEYSEYYDYQYENAPYFFVKGDYRSNGRLIVYPGGTLKTLGNCYVRSYIQLAHDANIYSGGNLHATTGYIDAQNHTDLFARGDIKAGRYIVLQEDSVLYCGKTLRAATSIEAKTNSTVFVQGDIKAVLSTIKIRDNSTVFCGGSMTSLRYIELGKFDEKYINSRHALSECTCDHKCTSSDDATSQECAYCQNDYTRCKVKAECICTSPCLDEASRNTKCPVCNENFEECEYQGQCNCTTACTKNSVNKDCPECSKDWNRCSFNNEGAEEEEILKNDLGDDVTDKANGGTFYIGGALLSYNGYIREYGFSKVVVGKYVYTRNYLTLRSNADMWVLPETFNNNTYKKIVPVIESDGTLLGEIKKFIKSTAYQIKDFFSFKNGSVYSMGEITLNKNSSLMGTHDCYSFDQFLLKHDSLAYFGHDIKNYASSLQIDFDSNTPLVGFAAEGEVYTTMRCTSDKHPHGYTVYTKNYDPNKTYVCDKCGATLSKSTVKTNVTCPVTVYANNEIDIITSTDLKLCYMVACNGDVNILDVYSTSSNNDNNTKQLPNAIASYNGNISYQTMYGKISALFYAPLGNIKLDGYYQEVWGSLIGDTITVSTYYINLHRFTNWRTMDLEIAEVGNVYLVPKGEYEKASNNVDDRYLTTGNTDDETKGGASLFFDKSVLNNGTLSGNGVDSDNSALGGN